MALVEVKVPDIGDFDEVDVIELLVKVGDTVTAEQSLITVESDKASMEIPAPGGGVVKALNVQLGDKVKQGSLLLTMEAESSGQPASASAPASKIEEPAAAAEVVAAPARHAAVEARPQNEVAPASVAAPAPAPEGEAPAAPAGSVDIVIPDIGDFDEVTVVEVMVAAGDRVALEQSMITVESDKASMEIPSSQAGVVEALKVKIGDKVSKGSLIAVVWVEAAASGESSELSAQAAPAASSSASQAPSSAQPTRSTQASPPAPRPASAQEVAAKLSVPSVAPAGERTVPTAALPAHEPARAQGVLPHASPSIRKLARELGVPLDEVEGSGPKQRITQEDVQGFVKGVMGGSLRTRSQTAFATPAPATEAAGGLAGLLPWPKVDFAKFGPVERRDLSRIKKISGANLHRNWVMIPHVTSYDVADITELEAFRVATNKENEKSGVKVTMLAFVIKAVVSALRKFPDFNSSLDGDQLVYKQYMHIGFAADTPNGLVVPVLRDADKKGVLDISAEMAALSKKAREGKLGPSEMTGGCFSISSLGGLGTTYFTPLINAPEVAILGLSKSTVQPVWDGAAFQPRLMLPLSLSYDHRVIDGAAGARFNAYLAQVLADFRRVLL